MLLRLMRATVIVCLSASAFPASGNTPVPKRTNQNKGIITISVTANNSANTFIPNRALGAGVDGLEKGDIAHVYTKANIKAMLSAGFKPLSYRLRTDLGIEAWHWNRQGIWSDATHKQGYWTSYSKGSKFISISNGYKLPRRGNTRDQANNQDYSRLDDGDINTFWKSNPYLDRHFTGDSNTLHPQWVVIQLNKKRPINAIRIRWALPYATQYRVEYWQGEDSIYLNDNPPGKWQTFPKGIVEHGFGGNVLIRLSRVPIAAKLVRLTMIASSNTAPKSETDIRDKLGYAIREIYLGVVDSRGRFQDLIRHGKSAASQTIFYTSSTDPWHRVADKDENVEQPGFDRVFKSSLTNNMPMLTPVGLLYDTPSNAVAQLKWLKSRGYPVTHIEMGEEPDGQYVTPEDYGALYVQWADALHKVDRKLQLGGPGFQSSIIDYQAWPDKSGNESWMNRFLKYLRSHHHAADFNFFSFEWYPFDDVCEPTAPQLMQAPDLLTNILSRLQKSGLSRQIPWIITEYGYSSFAGKAEVEMAGALLNADIVGQFLTLGGKVAYLYGYEPNTLIREQKECNTWGNLSMFLSDDERKIKYPLATYYGARLLTKQWVQPGNGIHKLYRATSDIRNKKGQAFVTAYAVHRPDGKWALMTINKDPKRTLSVRIQFQNKPRGAVTPWRGKVDIYQYSAAQYVWHPKGENGYAAPNLPPQHTVINAGKQLVLHLPPYSLSVVRGIGKD